MDAIGVDAGGTWIKAARYNQAFEAIAEEKVPSGAADGADQYFASIRQVLEVLRGDDEVLIGLSMPGLLSRVGDRLLISPNVRGLSERSDEGIMIADAIGVESAVLAAENDANCAAVGEWHQGVGQADEAMTLLHLTWGTGVGTGFVTAGEPAYGWEGGHMPVSWEHEAPTACGCGSRVDLEAHIAVPHLLQQAQDRLAAGEASALTPSDFTDTKGGPIALVDQAEGGDALAQDIIVMALHWMARGLHQMATIAQPDVVAIGGGMMDREWLLMELRRAVDEESVGYLSTSLTSAQVHRAQRGNEAGRLGAALLAQQRKKPA